MSCLSYRLTSHRPCRGEDRRGAARRLRQSSESSSLPLLLHMCTRSSIVSGLSCCTSNDSVTSTYVHKVPTDPKISRPLENKGVARSFSAPAGVRRWCRWADLAQFKRRRGDKRGGAVMLAMAASAARQQGCRVRSGVSPLT